MTKKPYCPMTIEHEALEMNQAVAACEYKPINNGAQLICNQCKSGKHYWYAFDNDLPVEKLEEDVLYISASAPIDAQCKIVLKATYGQAFIGGASGQGSNTLDEPLINTTMQALGDRSADLEAWLTDYGTSTASLIANS